MALRLTPQAGGASVVKGRLVGTMDAADGLVAFLEPAGAKQGTQVSYHYHYISAIEPLTRRPAD